MLVGKAVLSILFVRWDMDGLRHAAFVETPVEDVGGLTYNLRVHGPQDVYFLKRRLLQKSGKTT